MIKNIWERYIRWLLKFLDTDHGVNQLKFAILMLCTMIFFGLFGLILFYYILGSSLMLYSFGVGCGYGRLFFDWEIEKYDKNFPYNKRYTSFFRFLSRATIVFVVLGATVVLIKSI